MKFAKKRKVIMWMVQELEDCLDKTKWTAVMFSNPSRYKAKK